jgi:tRNA 5-methylaminomethyl-2-thiouridine biosynthesis bifunctional protein
MPIASPFPALLPLQSHWRGRASFTLLDLDFEDGRRLLEVAAALLSDPDAPQCLHYFAVTPGWNKTALAAHADFVVVTAATLSTAAIDTPFTVFAQQLRGAWLPPTPGFQRLILAEGRLVLTLVSGELASSLPQLDLAFDAAYWRCAEAAPIVARWLGRLAAPDALMMLNVPVADADAIKKIRDDFLQAGFADPAPDAGAAIWTLRFSRRISSGSSSRHGRIFNLPVESEKHAIVIGAGLAGAAACHRLAARGWRCTLIEQHAFPAQQASGNAAGIFMPVLSQDDNPLSRLSRAAFLFALHVWEGLGGVGKALPGQICGVLQLARSDAIADADADIGPHTEATAGRPGHDDLPPDFARRLSSAEATDALQQRVAGGWWFAAAGWLRPGAVCEAMLKACGDRLQILYRRQVARLVQEGDIWQALDAAGSTIAQAPVVILANGVDAMKLAQAAHLPLTAIRGQVTHLPVSAANVPFVVCGDAYLTPSAQGVASLGATYDQDADIALRLASHQENIRHLQQMLPDWQPPPDPSVLDGRVGFRCVAADRLPLVGALPDPQQLAGNGDVRLQEMPRLAGLYGLLGYGSRGLIWAPLAAELLAAQLNGEPSPLPRDLADMLDPTRFALKQRRSMGKAGLR